MAFTNQNIGNTSKLPTAINQGSPIVNNTLPISPTLPGLLENNYPNFSQLTPQGSPSQELPLRSALGGSNDQIIPQGQGNAPQYNPDTIKTELASFSQQVSGGNAQTFYQALENYPNLKGFIENQLGLNPNYVNQMISTPQQGNTIDQLTNIISDSLNNQNVVSLSSPDGVVEIPGTIPDDALNVVVNLSPDQQVVFSGPRAGTAARIFADTYNNSSLFRDNFLNNLNKPSAVSADGFKRYNVLTSTGETNSGLSLPSDPTSQWLTMPPTGKELTGNYIKTFIHEFTHNLAPDVDPENQQQADSLYNADGTTSTEVCAECGEAHDREHSAFQAAVINELDENPDSLLTRTGYQFNANTSDYSNNLSILNDSNNGQPATNPLATTPTNKPSDEIASNSEGAKQSVLANGSTLGNTFTSIKDAVLQQGDYDAALQLLDNIGANETIIHQTLNPQDGSTRDQEYNVRELIFQELLMEVDSNNFFSTQDNDEEEKKLIGEFFNYIVTNSPQQGYADTIEKARQYLFMDFEDEGINFLTGLSSPAPLLESQNPPQANTL